MSDPDYVWAVKNGKYLRRQVLKKWMFKKRPTKTIIVIDNRDKCDNHGGKVVKSIQLPDENWIKEGYSEILFRHLLKHHQQHPKLPIFLIFHCMESVRRGPRCAKRFEEFMATIEVKFDYSIRVLEGGGDQWVRNYYSNSLLVEKYDDKIWGFIEFPILNDNRYGYRGHKGYVRPTDQVATEWSAAGSAVQNGAN